MKLNNNILLSSDNPNRAEILDYLRNYYVSHEDYMVHYKYTMDMGILGEVDEVVLSLLTDELKEDGNLAYLIAEHTA
jgi:hypothetical protein